MNKEEYKELLIELFSNDFSHAKIEGLCRAYDKLDDNNKAIVSILTQLMSKF